MGLGYGVGAGIDTRLINYHFNDGGKFQARSNSLMFASLLIAGLIGSVLFDIDIRLPFIASAIVGIFTSLVCLTLPNEPGKTDINIKKGEKSTLSDSEKNIVCVYCFSRGIILTYFTGFLPYHLFIDLDIPIYGFIAILTSYTLLGNISSNFIARKIKSAYAIRIMNLCLIISIVMYFSNNLIVIVFATILLGLTSGATRPICMNKLREMGSDVSSISNIMESIYSIINLTLLLIGGVLYNYYGFYFTLVLLSGVYVLYITLNIYYKKRSMNYEN